MQEMEITSKEQEAHDLITKLQGVVDSLPEQHLWEQRQMSDAVSRVADAIFARAAYRARSPAPIERFQRDPDLYEQTMDQARRAAIQAAQSAGKEAALVE